MVRLSDILKRAKEKEAQQKNKSADKKEEPKQKIEKKIPSLNSKQQEKAQPTKSVQHSDGMKRTGNKDEKECFKLYQETLDLVKIVHEKVKKDEQFSDEDKKMVGYVKQFVDEQLLNNDHILELIYLPIKDPTHIYNHVINVCIISIETGIGLKYDQKKLIELGTAAILHDIGMVKFESLYTQNRNFSKKEIKELKKHVEIGAEILKKFKNIGGNAEPGVYQEHERVDGSGYPKGLKGKRINEFAKVIGLSDVYEALNQNRPHRTKKEQYEIMDTVIGMKEHFGHDVLKAFLERMSCPYPIGSYVRLNSGEKGKVIGRNTGHSFRPIVEILFDDNNELLDKTRTINLTKYPTMHITSYYKREEE